MTQYEAITTNVRERLFAVIGDFLSPEMRTLVSQALAIAYQDGMIAGLKSQLSENP